MKTRKELMISYIETITALKTAINVHNATIETSSDEEAMNGTLNMAYLAGKLHMLEYALDLPITQLEGIGITAEDT